MTVKQPTALRLTGGISLALGVGLAAPLAAQDRVSGDLAFQVQPLPIPGPNAEDAVPSISDGLGREVFEGFSLTGQALDRQLASAGTDAAFGLWGNIAVRGAQQDALSTLSDGYDSNQMIFTLGADILANRDVRVGLQASYADISNQDLRRNTVPTESTDAQSYKLGAYAAIRLLDRGLLSGEIAYLTGSADTARSGVFGPIASSFDFDGFMGRATFGYDLLPDDGVTLTPFVGVNFARINFDDTREAGGFDFLVERGDAEYAELRGGVELGARLSDGVSGFVSAAVIRDLEESIRSFRLSSDQVPTFSAVMPLRALDRFELAAGASVELSDGFALDLSYHGDFNDGYKGHAARATLRIGF